MSYGDEVRKLGIEDLAYEDFISPGGVSVSGIQPVDVRAYGAKGDGVTDDTAAIQAAIASVGGTSGLVGGPYADSIIGGGIVYFPPGIYKITAKLLVDKSQVKLIGAGSSLTTIKYVSTSATITEMIRFKYASSCELSKLTLDGGTGQIGSNQYAAVTGLYLDLVDFFHSIDLVIKFTKLYGIKASRLWESNLYDLKIHSTGWYATATDKSSAIWWTNDGSETYPALAPASTGSNNTSFNKPTIAPYGNITRISTQNTENIFFNNLIYEAYPNTNTNYALNEDKIIIDNAVFNITFNGGMISLHKFGDQTGSGYAFNISDNPNMITIKDFTVWDDSVAGEYAGISGVLKSTSGFPVHVENLSIYDPYKRMPQYFYSNSTHITGGNIYINNQSIGVADNVDSYFAVGTYPTLFRADLYVRNTGITRLYSWKINNMLSQSFTEGMNLDTRSNLVTIDTSGGPVTIGVYPWMMVGRHFYIKKVSGDNNALAIGLNGGLIDNVAGPLSDNTAYAGYHIYCDGTNFWILDKYHP